MVRLVITDFPTVEDNENYYQDGEYDVFQKMFTYHSFKKYSVLLSKYESNDEIYSLNLLSKIHLPKNQFLIHITDEEYIILFNHNTVYTGKINQNFITDDMIKSILINRHIAMLSSGGEIDKVYYIVDSKYKSAIENILIENTKNDKNETIAESLGDINDLVLPLCELDTYKSYLIKMTTLIGSTIVLLWISVFGLNLLADKLLYKQSLENIKKEIKVEKRLAKRQSILLRSANKKHEQLIQCISKPEVKND